MSDLGARIREAAANVGGLNQLAAKIETSRSNLRNWLTGAQPKPDALTRIAEVTGVRLAWLVSGEPPKFAGTSYQPPRSEPRPPATIKYYNVRLSAGGGATALHESPGYDFSLEEMASELLGIPVNYVRIFPVRGDSMLPTLADGDMVVLDSRRKEPEEDKMYAFAALGDTYIKRAQWIDDRHLKWVSDNVDPRYAPMILDGDELRNMEVLGRVVWIWKAV